MLTWERRNKRINKKWNGRRKKRKRKRGILGVKEKENGERNAMFTRVECGLCKILHKNALISQLNYPSINIYNIIAGKHG